MPPSCIESLMLPVKTVKWVGDADGVLDLLDQRLLPQRVERLQCQTPQQVYEAIRTLAVRGAPAIGVAAAYGVCLALRNKPEETPLAEAKTLVAQTTLHLASSRPTAVNLFAALNRMKAVVQTSPPCTAQFKQRLLDEAHAINQQEQDNCQTIGRCGAPLVPDGKAVLTHCNAGALATTGIGTALAPFYIARQQHKRFTVYADETRPLLQGARLTAWELTQAGIETVVICDSMAAALMQAGRIQAVFVGADRIAANGDTANKIGTLGLSILARHYDIPFYVAAPSSTFDRSLPDGAAIPIEQRNGNEIRRFNDTLITPSQAETWNPAFDVTSAQYITAFITEHGILRPPFAESIAQTIPQQTDQHDKRESYE
ncbi:MAG TPA: S-methyl-5-thioribose-1-phosphate isomerase [Phycisphaerales bacterium]|nr:S-methyl-5-thioribose-1-phosphate isomerase [Phycisphaerales bacterium]